MRRIKLPLSRFSWGSGNFYFQMKKIILTLSLILLPVLAHAEVVTETVEYRDGDAVLKGYLAYDDATDAKRPGILVVHEWKGLNDYAKMRAEQLAALGYVAFAVDMYGDGIVAKDHEEAAKLSGAYRSDRAKTRERARAGYEVLKNNPLVDPEKMAAIGYCFGGMTVLEMARAGFDLKGVVSFHGGLDTPTPAEPGVIKAKVLVLHGADDPHSGAESVSKFEDEMRRAGTDWQVVLFGGAVHGFTVPSAGSDKSTGVAYDEKADKRSWGMMRQFFDEIFQ